MVKGGSTDCNIFTSTVQKKMIITLEDQGKANPICKEEASCRKSIMT